MNNALKFVWVAALTGCYRPAGSDTYFGPSDTPIEIPEGLAQSLGLETIDAPDGEPTAPANDAELQAAFDTLKTEHAALKATHQKAVDAGFALQAKLTELQAAFDTLKSEQVALPNLEAKAVLPTLEELMSIKGVGEPTAKTLLELLEKKQPAV